MVRDLADYCADAPQSGLVIGYGAATLEQVEAGLALLREQVGQAGADSRRRVR